MEISGLCKKTVIKAIWMILLAGMPAGICSAGPAPTGLLCELLAMPELTTIGDARPEFGWIVNAEIKGNDQTAYQIQVATDGSLLEQDNPNRWDSGKVVSANSINVVYGGAALSVNSSYVWRVRTWDKQDEVSAWSAAQTFKTGSSLSGYSTARYKQQTSDVAPVSVTKIEEGRWLVDFGRDAFGYIRWRPPHELLRMGTADSTLVRLTAGSQATGETVTVHFGEKLSGDGVDRNPGGTIRYYQTAVTMDGSTDYEIHPPGTTTGIAIPAEFGRIAPFRYVELVNCPYTVTPADIRQISVHYPFDDDGAAFVCDNQTLNEVWELCRYSIKPTSFCGVYVDGDRERKPYEADAYINQLCHYSVDREFSLARYSHEYLLSHATWPTEWKQHSIMMAWADYLYTGNSESLAEHYDTLKDDKLLAQYAREDGLLSTGDLRDIVDWPSGERDGYVFKPVNTVVNAFYYHTLNLMGKIAGVLGRTSDAEQFAQDASVVYQAFQSVCFNSQTGLYVDGEGTTHSSLHANMWALAFGLVPEARRGEVVDFVVSKGMACSVYGAQYLLEALYLSGEEAAALALMTSDGTRGWVNMMREGSTISMEAWGIQYKPNLDWNHAWGAAPANIIPRFVVGLRPLEPGFAKALIAPQPASLSRFEARIPTIRGAVAVAMDKQSEKCIFELAIPVNMTARLVIPRNCIGLDSVRLDDAAATIQHENGSRFIDPISSGMHVIVCE